MGILGVLLIMRKNRDKKRRWIKLNGKKGFTLLEAIVSVALFALMAVMFSTFMFTSTRLVNLSLAYDSDRERLVEAIETGNTSSVTVTVVSKDDADGGYTYQPLTLELNDKDNQIQKRVTSEGTYYIYTLKDSGVKYCIYVGD